MYPKAVDTNNIDRFMPKVSVVIPIYNGETDLPDLLACLLAQTYPSEQVEYLLVDNNSSDRTFAQLETAAAHSHINICPLLEDNIQSSYAARNRGIRHATGEIIAFTDADCRPEPHWLESLVKPFIEIDVAIVAGEISALSGQTILERFADKHETLSQKHTLANKFCPYGQTANLAIRRIALEKAGLFRPYLTTGGDADICWRIQQENIGRIEFVPDAIVKHRHRATLWELASQWRRYGRSNLYLHELHGVDLMREISQYECIRRIIRWLVRDLPKYAIKAIIGRVSLIDILGTPIGIYTARARYQGQRDAKLPENAAAIDWL